MSWPVDYRIGVALLVSSGYVNTLTDDIRLMPMPALFFRCGAASRADYVSGDPADGRPYPCTP